MTIINMVGGGGTSGPQVPLDAISVISAVGGDTEATITWTDPSDLVVNGVTVTTWTATKLVRKVGSAPVDSTDGTLVVTETVRDTYSSTGYNDTGLTNGTTYYYAAFAVGNNGLETISSTTPDVTPAQGGWTPLNPMCWYKFDGDYTDSTGNFGVASGTSTFQTLASGVKVLQTDGTNIVLLPSGVTDTAITTYTIAFWMKTITTSPNYGYYAGCGNDSYASMSFYENTSGRNYYERGQSNDKNTRDITISGLTTGWRLICLRSNGTSRSDVSLIINGQDKVTSGGTSGTDSSSIFGYSSAGQFAIGARYDGTSYPGTKTSIQMSNFVISHSYWDDATCLEMYNETKGNYGL